MQCTSRVVLFLGAVAWASTAWAKLTPEQVRQLPPPATRTVDFRKDIQPILEASCIKCHARGKSKGGFLMDTRETALRDSDSGPSVLVGNSADSLLIELVSGLNTENLMPQKGSKLTPEQVGLLRAWIDQGMKWDPAVSFAKPAPRNLEPRQVSLPNGASGNPVDQFITDYFKAHGKNPPSRIDDRAFIRRVSLDAIGVIPEPDVVEAFVRDASPDKRSRLVERLLADKHRYAQHWLTFWNDLLRNDYRGTGYIDGGRKQITGWLYTALRDNKPYDHFVRELINPSAESEGFIKGIVWRGAVNASMVPPMQAAQNISQIFMGVNLKCASCHDSFIDDWQLSDSYGLAGIYADGPMEMVQCDKPTGRTAPLKFLFPELGGIDAAAPKTQRLQQLSGLITSPKNGRLSRTVVNRLWARFLGRGLVEPLDVMQNEAWLPPLLDWLAEDLVAHQWDLKRTMALILTSGAYQMPAVDSPEKDGKPLPDFAFAGPVIRRLSAEQFRDALSVVTGVWAEKPDGNLHTELSAGVEAPALSASAFWIWNDTHAANGVAPGAVQFRREFSVPSTGLTEAVLWLSVDNEAKVFVNGQSATLSGRAGPGELARVDLLALLKVGGTNVLAIEAVNGGTDRNPAGLLAYAKLRAGGTVLDFGSDAAWAVASGAGEFWKLGDFGNSRWAKAAVLGEPGMQPWPASRLLPAAVAELGGFAREFRSSLLAADPLTTALGRPNREQVNTVRAQTATTLQALELTNGSTLARLLRTGAEKLSSRYADNPELARRVFEAALSRPPTPAETRLAVDLLASGTRTDAVEDLLWSVAMLPEFQLIL